MWNYYITFIPQHCATVSVMYTSLRVFVTAPYLMFILRIYNGKILGRYLSPQFFTFSCSCLMLHPTTAYITTACVATNLPVPLHNRYRLPEAGSPSYTSHNYCLKADITASWPFQGLQYQVSILIWGTSK